MSSTTRSSTSEVDAPSYRSFLLRIWHDQAGSRHCEVEAIQSGELIEFPSLDAALTFIRRAAGAEEAPAASADQPQEQT